MEIKLKTVCEQAFHSKENGNLNIIGIFDQIRVSQFPAVHAGMAFVFIIEDTPGEYEYYMEIEDRDGNKIFNGSGQRQKGQIGPNGRSHLIINMRGAKFEKEGVYKVNFYINGQKETIEIDVLDTNK